MNNPKDGKHTSVLRYIRKSNKLSKRATRCMLVGLMETIMKCWTRTIKLLACPWGSVHAVAGKCTPPLQACMCNYYVDRHECALLCWLTLHRWLVLMCIRLTHIPHLGPRWANRWQTRSLHATASHKDKTPLSKKKEDRIACVWYSGVTLQHMLWSRPQQMFM